MAEHDGCRRKRLEQRLPHGRVGIVLPDRLKNFISVGVASQRALRLRCPVQCILAQQRIVLCLQQPAERLCVAVFRIVFVSERQRRARAPDAGGIFHRERRQLLVSPGNSVAQRPRQIRKFFLRRFIGRRIRNYVGR